MRKLVWILAAFLSLTAVTTASAAESAHAKSGGFFAFFRNLFSSGDSPESHPAEAAPAQKKTKFIYLDDGSSPSNDVLLGTSVRVHAAPLIYERKDAQTPNLLFERDHAGLSSLLHTAAPVPHNTQKAGARLNLTFPTADRANPLSDLDISLISRAAVEAPEAAGFGAATTYNGSFERRTSSLGLNVDYRGFYAGANYGKQQDSLAIGYHGYDVGFGYQGHKWSTGIQFSGYRKDGDIMGLVGPDGIRAVQVGAAYSLWPWITFSGQFRYYDYNNRGNRDLLLDQSRVFTLGTSLNF